MTENFSLLAPITSAERLELSSTRINAYKHMTRTIVGWHHETDVFPTSSNQTKVIGSAWADSVLSPPLIPEYESVPSRGLSHEDAAYLYRTKMTTPTVTKTTPNAVWRFYSKDNKPPAGTLSGFQW
jgi:hypothetical protein